MLDLTIPISSLCAARRRATLLLTFLLSSVLAVIAGARLGSPFVQLDASSYLDLAAGRPAMLPFAWRQLGPLLVHLLGLLLHVSLQSSFVLEGTLALAIFLSVVLLLFVRSSAPLWMLPALTGLFFWAAQWNTLALPDVTFAALLAVFFLLLSRERILPAAVMLFPLALARESALLVLACLLFTGWRCLRRSEVAAAIAATTAGTVVVNILSASALPNREHLSGILYLMAKLPVNLLRNIFGIELWANIYNVCPVPRWQTSFHLGTLQSIGICSIGSAYPLNTLISALASFGLFPLLLFKLRQTPIIRKSLLLRFCLLYGTLSFLLAPMLGFLVTRLFDYAWPLFLVALPLLVGVTGTIFTSSRAALLFLILHLVLSWSVWWVFFAAPLNLLEVEVALYAAGFFLLRTQKTAR